MHNMMPQEENQSYHPTTGCCIHHPHVQMRKRKVFMPGTGVVLKWKIYMTRCPQCVVEALRAERVVERHNRSFRCQNKMKNEDEESRRTSCEHEHIRSDNKHRESSKKSSTAVVYHRKESASGDSSTLTSTYHSSSSSRDTTSFGDEVDSSARQRSATCHRRRSPSTDSMPRSMSPQSSSAVLAVVRKSGSGGVRSSSRTRNCRGDPAAVSKGQRQSSACASASHTSHQDNERVVACSIPLKIGNTPNKRVMCSYTGQINLNSQLPDGKGTLVYDDTGKSMEGEWRMGALLGTEIWVKSVIPPVNTGPSIPRTASSDTLCSVTSVDPPEREPRRSRSSNSSSHTKATSSTRKSITRQQQVNTSKSKSSLEQLADLDNLNASLRSLDNSCHQEPSASVLLPFPAELRGMVAKGEDKSVLSVPATYFGNHNSQRSVGSGSHNNGKLDSFLNKQNQGSLQGSSRSCADRSFQSHGPMSVRLVRQQSTGYSSSRSVSSRSFSSAPIPNVHLSPAGVNEANHFFSSNNGRNMKKPSKDSTRKQPHGSSKMCPQKELKDLAVPSLSPSSPGLTTSSVYSTEAYRNKRQTRGTSNHQGRVTSNGSSASVGASKPNITISSAPPHRVHWATKKSISYRSDPPGNKNQNGQVSYHLTANYEKTMAGGRRVRVGARSA